MPFLYASSCGIVSSDENNKLLNSFCKAKYSAAFFHSVDKTVLLYDTKAINDLHAMLKKHGDWMELGGADEQKPAKDGNMESWAVLPRTRLEDGMV